MGIQVVVFRITGISPLLMNNPASMGGEEPGGKATTRTKTASPEDEAEARVYADEGGGLFFPTIAFVNSLWEGASYQKFGKDSARSRISAAVFAMEPSVPLLSQGTGDPIIEYEIDSRYVVIKATKGRVMRHRPLVRDWACDLPLELDLDYIVGPDALLPIFNRAGRVIGVGDYRPAKRGPFGRYEVEVGGNWNGKKKRLSRSKLSV